MTDKNGVEIKVDDDVNIDFININGNKNIKKGFIRAIFRNKKTDEEIALVKLESSRLGGFGSCLCYPKRSKDLEKI